ncbi:serine/threonine-protein kinase HAL4/sat4 [Kalmusia sp. IMI 367209]|nr:serine/threonine-protein kinase HAL4/sat4 [Kalmusia sp. IMI 367209]
MQNKTPSRIKHFINGTHEHCLASIVPLHNNNSTITRFIHRVKNGDQAVPSDEVPLVIDHGIFDYKASTSDSSATLKSKYGRYKEVLGWGSSSTVKMTYKPNPHIGQKGRPYAVKVFRQHDKESESAYHKRASAEFCIATTLQHKNVVHTLDLLNDNHGHMCQVMEFCAGGDLCALILSVGKLEETEADCLYKQLMRGITHCHNAGVAHRNLKPENILLTTAGCLKISDFGMAECVQYAWEETCHRSTGLQGSQPYMAPEVYTTENFDAKAIDIWSTGVIYVAMRTRRLVWNKASGEDNHFHKFVMSCGSAEGFRPIELFEGLLYATLRLNPQKRMTGPQVLDSQWLVEIMVCKAGNHGY